MNKYILAFLVLILSTPAFADKYVKASCTYNGDGTAASCAAGAGQAGAYKNFSNISWSDGDTIRLVTGETWTGQMLAIGANNVTVTVSGSGTATIDTNGTTSGIHINGKTGVTIDGLHGDATAGDTTYGIKVSNIGTDQYAVYLGPGSGAYNIVVKHIEATGKVYAGDVNANIDLATIFLQPNAGGTVEVAYNWIHGPTPTSGGTTACCSGGDCASHPNSQKMWCAAGITVWNGSFSNTSYTTNLIHHNKVENLFIDGIKWNGNGSVYNNQVYHIETSGHSDSILLQSGGYSKIYNNDIASADQQIYVDHLYNGASQAAKNIWIYNNVVNDEDGHGIQLVTQAISIFGAPGYIDNVFVFNNTVSVSSYCFWQNAEDGAGTITNTYFKNNICYKTTGNGSVKERAIAHRTTPNWPSGGINYNIYGTGQYYYPDINDWDGGSTLAEMRANHSMDLQSAVGNPTFMSSTDFHLQASDIVAKDLGVDLSSYGSFLSLDKDGASRPQDSAWDIGAYEAEGWDTTPTAFSFTDNTGVAQSTVIYSTSITVLGIDNVTSITSSGAGCSYQVNGAGSWLTTGGDNVALNDNVAMKTTSSANYSTQNSCTLTLNGNVSDTWYVTTEAAIEDIVPPTPPRMRAVTISGSWR